MENIRENLQIFVRRFGLLNASCCEECCGEQVSLVQSHALFEIRRKGNPSIQQVADELGIDITTFSRQIKALEEKGFVAKHLSQSDRRVNLLGLTDEGFKVVAQIDHFMDERLEGIFSRLTEFEKETVARSLGLLNQAVEEAGCCCSNTKPKVELCK